MSRPDDLNYEVKTVLITGAAGFIGANLSKRLLEENKDVRVIGIDNISDYYSTWLKEERIKWIEKSLYRDNWTFFKGDISDKSFIQDIFKKFAPDIVINLAAQAGVRYSITNPESYINSNIVGFYNVLEACRSNKNLKHFVFASSSSVYGGRTNVPFRETDKVDEPVSLYAATKKSDELLAYSYANLYNIHSTGLRFFTVYGPAGRPDMAYFDFANKLACGDKIKVFNFGKCERDFTYIDDVVEGIIRVMDSAPIVREGADGLLTAPYEIYNLGNSKPENLMVFVRVLSEELVRVGVLEKDFNIEKHIELVPMQPGDVPITYSDTSKMENRFGYKPTTDIRTGLRKFAEWYEKYYLYRN